MINDGSGPTLAQILEEAGAPDGGLGKIAPELLERALLDAGVGVSQFRYLFERLANPDLLLLAVPVGKDLAVPAVLGRRAGCVFAPDDDAATVARNLAARPGYPDARVVSYDDEEYPTQVRWGGDEAPLPDWEESDTEWARLTAADGRMYGYHDDVIREAITGHYGRAVANEVLRIEGHEP
ncbi:DUF6302 family protein [Nocardia sp. NPDC049220]|uniref:DUF6302 family protein n=1 Tax=Nocardia sp. NPDC049220 TaxID=3155273 RepID=UPI0033C03116